MGIKYNNHQIPYIYIYFMTEEKTKVRRNLEMIHGFIATEAPISFERVCIACGFSPSKLYSYISLIHEEYPWIRYNDKHFYFDLFSFNEHNPIPHSTQNNNNKQTKLEEEKRVEK